FGRPKNGPEDKYSLRHIVSTVEKNIGTKVLFATDSIGESAKSMATALKSGEVLLLENVRFYAGEQKGDREFARELSTLGDCFVFDAFGAAHRADASTTIIAEFFPNDKMFGYVMEQELDATRRVLETPERPYVAIIGGAKVSSKITIIERLMEKVDRIIIGGGMAYTFAAADGGHIGSSLCEQDQFDTAHRVVAKAKERGVKLYLSEDSVCGDAFSNDANVKIFPSNE
ncbi:MAG: phosphoglycerate kinase, partial [Rikenellaceae bacterium]